MKKHTKKTNKSAKQQFLTQVLVLSFMASVTLSAQANDSYQHKMLFTPNSGMVKAENHGRVMIYDGIKNDVVDVALNEQFDRIENMMFVRVVHVQEDGEEIADEDDCD